MTRSIPLLLSLLGLWLSTTSCFAQQPSAPAPAPPAAASATPDPARMAAAREMMSVAGVSRQFDQVMPMLAQQLSQSFIALAPDKAGDIKDVFSQLSTRFIDRKNELIDAIAGLYAAELSVEEMNAIVAFYKSPAGMRFIEVQPNVMRQSMAIGQRWGQNIGHEIEMEARKELKKRGIEL